jgi:uncharacterized membrane protein
MILDPRAEKISHFMEIILIALIHLVLMVILFEDNIIDDEFVWNKLWGGFGVVAFLLTVFVAGVYVQRLYRE